MNHPPSPFSPVLWIAKYDYDRYYDGTIVSVCLTSVDSFWPASFFVGSISLFFILPFCILLVLYTVIARHLMNNPGITSHGNRSNVMKYRKQVIFMLGAVVISFFVCLLPFRAFTLWIIIVPPELILQLGIEGYYSILYFSRIMLYINSALNPILYNLMSSKFREGFLRLLGCKSVVRHTLISGRRKGTFHTASTNLSSSTSGDKRKSGRIRDDSETITASIIIKNGIEDIILISGDSEHSSVRYEQHSLDAKRNGFAKRKRSTFDDIDEIEEITPIKEYTVVSGELNQTLCKKKKKNDKEVLFSHQNGQNDDSSKRRPSTSTVSIESKSKIPAPIAIESSVDDTGRYSTKYNASYTSHLDCIIVDENETKLFLPQSIGTESFV